MCNILKYGNVQVMDRYLQSSSVFSSNSQHFPVFPGKSREIPLPWEILLFPGYLTTLCKTLLIEDKQIPILGNGKDIYPLSGGLKVSVQKPKQCPIIVSIICQIII